MPLHGKNILGNSLSAEGTRTFQAVNPATGEKLETTFHDATPGEADRALELAGDAFHANRPGDPGRIAELLQRAADEIESAGDELIDRAGAETGLPDARLTAERGRTTGQLRSFAALVSEGSWVDARIDRAAPERKPIPKPDLRRMLVPVGPVVVFGASNFPLAFSTGGGDTASALAAGCPVLVKAHPAHPGTSELVAQALQKAVAAAGLPDGWFSMLHSPGHRLGLYLVKHPRVRAVGFTGSAAGGKALLDAAASRPDPIPVYAEMGSINPVFLMPGALRERAGVIAEGLHQSVTLGVGQFCTNPGLIVAVDDENLGRLLVAMGRLVEGTPPGTMLTEGILDGYELGMATLSGIAGVERVARSAETPDRGKTQAAAALFVADADAFLEKVDLQREVFGPATLVVRCRNERQMVEVARNLEGQLTATLHAADDELAACGELLAVLETKAGRLLLGGFPTGVEVCPSMHHGGPYPATTDAHFTSVGTAAIERFARPVCYQNFPQSQLPRELRDKNERGIWRLVDGLRTRDQVAPVESFVAQ